MKIWVLASKVNFKVHGNARLKEEAKKHGIQLKMVAPEDFEIVEPMFAHQAKILYKNKYVSLPDCVIPRMGSGTTYFALAVIRMFERIGVFVMNSSESIEYAKDKLHSIQMLSQASLPIPKTMLAKSPLNFEFIEKEFHFPVILKKISGSQGKGVILCENQGQLEDITELTSGGPDKLNFILQEFISASRGKDIRVFVLGGRAIGGMVRKAKEGKYKANHSAGGSVENLELTPEIEWIAVESARVLGLEMAGVDILIDEDGFRICEVNSSPGYKGLELATGINVPEEIFRFISVRVDGVS